MKTILLLVSAFLLTSSIFSQYSEIYVYSNDGQKFLLLIDGKMINEKPETAVRAKEYFNESCILTVKFEDESIKSLSKKMRILPAGNEFVMRIKNKKKKKYKLVKQESNPLIADVPSYMVFDENYGKPVPEPNTVVTETTTTTTTTSTGDPGSQSGLSVDINVNNPHVNGNLNLNLGSGADSANTNTETSVTTTTSVTEVPPTVEPIVPGYEGRVCCELPMNNKKFNKYYSELKNVSGVSDKKLNAAEMYFESNCLTVSQIFKIMDVLEFAYTKMKFAKFAYLRVFDINNYDKVVKSIENSNYRTELDNFILQNPR